MKMNTISVSSLSVSEKKLTITFEVSPQFDIFFDSSHKFECEYSSSIEDVPISILVIPFVTNILPLIWLLDLTLIVPDIDRNFYDNIEKIKAGYQQMYPDANFKGKIVAGKITAINISITNKSLLFFSGGVDAYSSLVVHHRENPDFVLVGGADVNLDDRKAWDKVQKSINHVSRDFGTDVRIITSNFRKFINYEALDKLVRVYRDNWWHGFQHGIGLIGLAAPLSYIYRYRIIYIASSYTKGDIYTCASDPSIDNNVHLGLTEVYHDGYEFTRQDKIRNIVLFSKEMAIKINLRVCYMADAGGENCAHCEKCYRTIMALYAEGADPNNFGFVVDKMKMLNMINDIKYRMFIPDSIKNFWIDIQKSAIRNSSVISTRYPELFHFLSTFDFQHPNSKVKFLRYYLSYLLNPLKLIKRLLSF